MSTVGIIATYLAYLLVLVGAVAAMSLLATVFMAGWAWWARRKERQLSRETARYLREASWASPPRAARVLPPDDDDAWLAQL